MQTSLVASLDKGFCYRVILHIAAESIPSFDGTHTSTVVIIDIVCDYMTGSLEWPSTDTLDKAALHLNHSLHQWMTSFLSVQSSSFFCSNSFSLSWCSAICHQLSLNHLGERCCVYISIVTAIGFLSLGIVCTLYRVTSLSMQAPSSFLWLFKNPHSSCFLIPLSTHVLYLADELCILTATLCCLYTCLP